MRCVLDNGVSFISNHAELDGGAVHISNVLSMIVREASFIGNEAHQGGAAALYVVVSSSPFLLLQTLLPSLL